VAYPVANVAYIIFFAVLHYVFCGNLRSLGPLTLVSTVTIDRSCLASRCRWNS